MPLLAVLYTSTHSRRRFADAERNETASVFIVEGLAVDAHLQSVVVELRYTPDNVDVGAALGAHR